MRPYKPLQTLAKYSLYIEQTKKGGNIRHPTPRPQITTTGSGVNDREGLNPARPSQRPGSVLLSWTPGHRWLRFNRDLKLIGQMLFFVAPLGSLPTENVILLINSILFSTDAFFFYIYLGGCLRNI